MTFKRLYYDFALHGGAVGVHDLGQGSSYEHQLLWNPGLFYVFSPTLTNTDFDLGTTLQPQLLFAGLDLTGLPANAMQSFTIGPVEALFSSHWVITFHTIPETGGNWEFIFDSNRRQ